MTSPTSNFGSTPVKPPEMSDKEIRLECLKQAVINAPGSNGVISLAKRMFDFVSSGTPS